MKEQGQVVELLEMVQKQNKRTFCFALIIILSLFTYIGYDRYKDSLNAGIDANQEVHDNENTTITQDIE